MKRLGSCLGLCLAAALAAHGDALAAAPKPPPPAPAFDTRPLDFAAPPSGTGAEVAPGAEGAFQVVFAPGRSPQVEAAAPAGSPWDWSGYGGVAVDVANPGAETVTLGMKIDDATGSRSLEGRIMLPPRSTESVLLPFIPAPKSLGIHAVWPAAPEPFRGMWIQGKETPDFAAIASLKLFVPRTVHPISTNQPEGPITLAFSHPRLVRMPVPTLDRAVDAYGQSTRGEWPGKVAEDKDLLALRAAEEADLAAHPDLPDRDAYGGWTKGPALDATGFFRVQKATFNGAAKWTFVDPDGRPFVAAGLYSAGPGRATYVTGRETMFSWLPAPADPLRKYRSYRQLWGSGAIKEGQTFDFYCANLERKYGPEWPDLWKENTLARFRSWGFNLLTSFGSDWTFPGTDASLAKWKLPYALVLGPGQGFARTPMGSNPGQTVPDPFDPRFRAALAKEIAGPVAANLGNPWLLGYFVNNEIHWGIDVPEAKFHHDLAYGALKQPAGDSPAKREFLRALREKYRTPVALAAAWGIPAPASWEALDAPFSPADAPNAAVQADLSAFVSAYAEAYFRTVREELKKADPNHLYLGCRDAFWLPEELAAAAKYCDVLSLNVYQPKLPPKLAETFAALDKPCLITEFHSGALDRGLFNPSLVWAPDQAARGEQFVQYVHTLLAHPSVVGWNWYEYVDEPLLGRLWDGENLNDGFVSVVDAPYPEMVKAARAVHAEAYPLRFGDGK